MRLPSRFAKTDQPETGRRTDFGNGARWAEFSHQAGIAASAANEQSFLAEIVAVSAPPRVK